MYFAHLFTQKPQPTENKTTKKQSFFDYNRHGGFFFFLNKTAIVTRRQESSLGLLLSFGLSAAAKAAGEGD